MSRSPRSTRAVSRALRLGHLRVLQNTTDTGDGKACSSPCAKYTPYLQHFHVLPTLTQQVHTSIEAPCTGPAVCPLHFPPKVDMCNISLPAKSTCHASLHSSENTRTLWAAFHFYSPHAPAATISIVECTDTTSFLAAMQNVYHSSRQRKHLPPKSPGPPYPCQQPCILHSTRRDHQ